MYHGGVREEKLFAADPVRADRFLPFAGNDPVDEGLPQVSFYAGMPCGIHEDDAVLIEQAFIALDQHGELATVLEREPGRAVGEDVRIQAGCGIERPTHPSPGLAVPAALFFRRLDTGRLP